jgi:hypothetical protein
MVAAMCEPPRGGAGVSFGEEYFATHAPIKNGSQINGRCHLTSDPITSDRVPDHPIPVERVQGLEKGPKKMKREHPGYEITEHTWWTAPADLWPLINDWVRRQRAAYVAGGRQQENRFSI